MLQLSHRQARGIQEMTHPPSPRQITETNLDKKLDPRLTIITPVFNDWSCLNRLASELGNTLQHFGQLSLLVINDGSTEPYDSDIKKNTFSNYRSVRLINLGCNVGHQRAIAIGISLAASENNSDFVCVIDSDGEDVPSDALVLIKSLSENPECVIVAKRTQRTESGRFKASYFVYKYIFSLLTGKNIDFGNFAAFSMSTGSRFAYMPELWNHFAATLLKSRVPIRKIALAKGPRFYGKSRMNFVSLVNHGLAAISVLVDIAFARLLLLSTLMAAMLLILGLVILLIRGFTLYAIPGWATIAFGFVSLGLVQILVLVSLVSFLALSTRSNFNRPTIHTALEYISSIEELNS
ncbi:MAG: glycosyltransferase [Cyanobacteriota bacterium]